MNLQSVREGDIVQVNKRGRLFLASVVEKERGKVKIDPLLDNINYFEASAREVVAHWRKSGVRTDA